MKKITKERFQQLIAKKYWAILTDNARFSNVFYSGSDESILGAVTTDSNQMKEELTGLLFSLDQETGKYEIVDKHLGFSKIDSATGWIEQKITYFEKYKHQSLIPKPIDSLESAVKPQQKDRNMFSSEIRPSEINKLIDKVRGGNYGKYLSKISLQKLRAFEHKEISFDFPVTALIGPNGGGKTTVLGAAGIAYKDVKPSRFFAKSGVYDDSMQNWKVEYELIDKGINPRNQIKRTAGFKNLRWSRDSSLSRDVLIFGVSRTVPANERAELRRCASTNFEAPPENISQIAEGVINASEKILGKDISDYNYIKVDDKGRVSLLTGVTEDEVRFSEFHFGAGESSIIRMVMQIETIPDNSLILIEEIENGLHPIATIRMVEYLIDVANRKSSQVIFTTHSNDALNPLPPEAIWSCINGDIIQGKLDIKSLRAITGQVQARLAIFVEDDFAKKWIETCLSTEETIHFDEIEVHGMEGDGTAVMVNKYHNQNPTKNYNSICYIDGDSQQKEDDDGLVFRLPGEYPETYIFDKILDNIDEFGGELTVALHRPYERHKEIIEIVKRVRRTNRDYHLLFSQVGKEIGFISESVVVSAFVNLWAQKHPEEVERILAPIILQLHE